MNKDHKHASEISKGISQKNIVKHCSESADPKALRRLAQQTKCFEMKGWFICFCCQALLYAVGIISVLCLRNGKDTNLYFVSSRGSITTHAGRHDSILFVGSWLCTRGVVVVGICWFLGSDLEIKLPQQGWQTNAYTSANTSNVTCQYMPCTTWYHDLCLNTIFVHLSEKTTSVGVWDAHCILILFGFYRYLNNNTKMKLTRWGVLSLLKFPRKSLLSFTRVLTTRLVDKAPRQTDQLSRPAQESNCKLRAKWFRCGLFQIEDADWEE